MGDIEMEGRPDFDGQLGNILLYTDIGRLPALNLGGACIFYLTSCRSTLLIYIVRPDAIDAAFRRIMVLNI